MTPPSLPSLPSCIVPCVCASPLPFFCNQNASGTRFRTREETGLGRVRRDGVGTGLSTPLSTPIVLPFVFRFSSACHPILPIQKKTSSLSGSPGRQSRDPVLSALSPHSPPPSLHLSHTSPCAPSHGGSSGVFRGAIRRRVATFSKGRPRATLCHGGDRDTGLRSKETAARERTHEGARKRLGNGCGRPRLC